MENKPNNKAEKLEKKQQEARIKELNAEIVIKLKRGEINLICNIIAGGSYKLADLEIIRPVFDKLFSVSSGNTRIVKN